MDLCESLLGDEDAAAALHHDSPNRKRQSPREIPHVKFEKNVALRNLAVSAVGNAPSRGRGAPRVRRASAEAAAEGGGGTDPAGLDCS